MKKAYTECHHEGTDGPGQEKAHEEVDDEDEREEVEGDERARELYRRIVLPALQDAFGREGHRIPEPVTVTVTGYVNSHRNDLLTEWLCISGRVKAWASSTVRHEIAHACERYGKHFSKTNIKLFFFSICFMFSALNDCFFNFHQSSVTRLCVPLARFRDRYATRQTAVRDTQESAVVA